MRRIALMLLCLPIAGCGFHPLYGSADRQAEAHLPDVFVAVIAGRPGQLLRQELQQRLAGSSEATPQGYTLRVTYVLENEAIGIHGDNTSARTRMVGRANWTLNSVALAPVTLASGAAHSVDGFDTIDTQYFSAIISTENTQGRIAGNLADAITTQVASWFASHPSGTATEAEPAHPPPAPTPSAPQPGFLGPQNVPDDSTQSPLQTIGPDGLPSGAIGR